MSVGRVELVTPLLAVFVGEHLVDGRGDTELFPVVTTGEAAADPGEQSHVCPPVIMEGGRDGRPYFLPLSGRPSRVSTATDAERATVDVSANPAPAGGASMYRRSVPPRPTPAARLALVTVENLLAGLADNHQMVA